MGVVCQKGGYHIRVLLCVGLAHHGHTGDQLGVCYLVPLGGQVKGYPQGVVLQPGGSHIGLGQHGNGVLRAGHLGGHLGGFAVILDVHILVRVKAVGGKQIAQHILRGSALAGGQDGAALEVCHAVDGVALLHHIQNAQGVHRHGLNAAVGFLVQGRCQIGRDSGHVQLALDEQRHDLIRSAVELQIVVHGGSSGLLHREQVDKPHGGGTLQPGDAQWLGGRQRRSSFFLRSSRRGSSFGHRRAGNGRACAAAAGCKAQCKAERQQ